MKRMVFRSVAKFGGSDPVEVFWRTGFHRTEDNEWKVGVVYRNKRTEELKQVYEPIGMLPLLSLAVWFEHGVIQANDMLGEQCETIIPDVGAPEVITSAQLASDLYALPQERSGTQRLFRYHTAIGGVIIPAIELIRVLFAHNRALALALMRPAGLEQLIAPMEPGHQDTALLRFTKEMPKSAIGRDLAMNVAWIALDQGARRSWDSVSRLSVGQSYALLDPPAIKKSVWAFQGVRAGNQWFVLELKYIGGRELPVRTLQYSHPGFRKIVVSESTSNLVAPGAPDVSKGEGQQTLSGGYDVDDGEGGSASYHGALITEMKNRRLVFENDVHVIKVRKEVGGWGQKVKSGAKKPVRKVREPSPVTTGERTRGGRIPPIEFKTLASSPLTSMGDLVALDETVRHMRDMLPDVRFSMALVELKQGSATAGTVGLRRRVGMVVTIQPPERPPIAVIDVERAGIAALSLMSMHFLEGTDGDGLEAAVKLMLDGWSESGGHWPTMIEGRLASRCHCQRLPKALVPREAFSKLGRHWAIRLISKLDIRG